MSGSRAAQEVPVIDMGHKEAGDVFDGICRHELGMSRAEFLRRWDAGEYQDLDVDSIPGLVDVVLALSLVR